MRMANRRAIITSLAAVDSPSIVPLPIFAALDRRSVVLRSRWHYREPVANEISIRHLETGLTFQRRPTEADQYALALAGVPPPMDAADIQLIGRAARFVSLQALLVLTCRPEHEGAVFFRYRPDADPDNPYNDPLTEDAPPLPRIAV